MQNPTADVRLSRALYDLNAGGVRQAIADGARVRLGIADAALDMSSDEAVACFELLWRHLCASSSGDERLERERVRLAGKLSEVVTPQSEQRLTRLALALGAGAARRGQLLHALARLPFPGPAEALIAQGGGLSIGEMRSLVDGLDARNAALSWVGFFRRHLLGGPLTIVSDLFAQSLCHSQMALALMREPACVQALLDKPAFFLGMAAGSNANKAVTRGLFEQLKPLGSVRIAELGRELIRRILDRVELLHSPERAINAAKFIEHVGYLSGARLEGIELRPDAGSRNYPALEAAFVLGARVPDLQRYRATYALREQAEAHAAINGFELVGRDPSWLIFAQRADDVERPAGGALFSPLGLESVVERADGHVFVHVREAHLVERAFVAAPPVGSRSMAL